MPRRLTLDPSIDGEPIISPDGGRVVFVSDRKANVWDMYERFAHGRGEETLLLQSGENKNPRDWLLDGRYILYASQSPKTDFDLWTLAREGDRTPIPIAQTSFVENQGRFAPDGRAVAVRIERIGAYGGLSAAISRAGTEDPGLCGRRSITTLAPRRARIVLRRDGKSSDGGVDCKERCWARGHNTRCPLQSSRRVAVRTVERRSTIPRRHTGRYRFTDYDHSELETACIERAKQIWQRRRMRGKCNISGRRTFVDLRGDAP